MTEKKVSSNNVLNRSHFFAPKIAAKKSPAPTSKQTSSVVTLFPSLNAELEKLSQLVAAAEKTTATTFSNKRHTLFNQPSLSAAKAGLFSRPRPEPAAVVKMQRPKP